MQYSHEALPLLHQLCLLAVTSLNNLVVPAMQIVPVEIHNALRKIGILIFWLGFLISVSVLVIFILGLLG